MPVAASGPLFRSVTSKLMCDPASTLGASALASMARWAPLENPQLGKEKSAIRVRQLLEAVAA